MPPWDTNGKVNPAVMWNLDNYRRTIGPRRRQHVCGKFRCGFSREQRHVGSARQRRRQSKLSYLPMM
ncbi:hypothetical protein E2C01_046447 [Portunus trituberculatus]|uniref:Uncharacterized protein n=1 Tax=Portunus trituberculatus TaxID=210409 RepID=A0A5B7G4T9_PORTR|nr:hypothetical protein [Portunus trituberculatus]